MPQNFETTTSRKRVLFVSYAFPPTGGVGVHRVVKFVKYLPQFGWDASVLTVSNPSVPLLDETMSREIPDETIIKRCQTWEPGYGVKSSFSAGKNAPNGNAGVLKRSLKSVARSLANIAFQPDLQILWKPNAVKAGMKLLRETHHDAIIATAPPFSSLLTGAELSRRSGVPLILDYRDEWGISNSYWENKQQNRFSRWYQERLENRVAREADVLLATTPSSRDSLDKVIERAGSQATAEYIYNGYDPDDYNNEASESVARKDYGNGVSRYRLSYVGTLWNLNRVEPLVEAVEQIAKRSPQLIENLELVFAGRRTDPQNEVLNRLEGLPCKLVRLPFVEHAEAVQLMRTSDGLVLLNSNVPHADRIVSGKAFEYIAAEKTIFIVSPRGDMWDLLSDCRTAFPCPPHAPHVFAEHLATELERFRMGFELPKGQWDPTQFERKHRAEELADLLENVTARTVRLPMTTLQNQTETHSAIS